MNPLSLTLTALVVCCGWLCWAVTPVAGTMQILSVSSFTPCVTGTVGIDGQLSSVNCSNTGQTTVVDMLVSSTVSVSVSVDQDDPLRLAVTDEAGVFLANFTVVPPSATGTQSTSLAQCQAGVGEPCQTTVPVNITVEEIPPIYVYDLKELPSTALGSMRSPWGNLYGWSVQTSYNPNTVKIIENQGGTCRLVTVTGARSLKSSYPKGLQENVTRIFENEERNAQMLGCPRVDDDTPVPLAEAPVGIGLVGSGMVRYHYECNALLYYQSKSSSVNSTFGLDVNAQFVPMAPSSRIFQITGQGVVQAGFRINATALASFKSLNVTAGQRETLSLTLSQNGLVGARGISKPYGLFAATALNVDTPSGNYGPFIGGLLVTVSNNADDRPLNMTPNANGSNPLVVAATGLSAPVVAPSLANPWWYDPDAPLGRGRLPVPSSMGFMTNNDPYATFYFLNTSQFAGVTRKCGGMCVDPNIYQNLDPIMLGSGANPRRNFVYPIEALIPPQNCDYFFQSVVVTTCGGLDRVLTCVPNKGLNFADSVITMPCEAVAQMQLEQQTIAQLLANGSDAALTQIEQMRLKHLPHIYDPLRPNMWVYNGRLYYQPTPKRGRSTGNILTELQLSFSGDFVGYAQRVPAGQLQLQSSTTDPGVAQAATTYCTAAWNAYSPQGVQGQVVYTACNPSNETSPVSSASYTVQSRCGLASQFVPDTMGGGVFNPAGQPDGDGRNMLTLNTPSSVDVSGVRSGQCKSVNAGGFLYFTGVFTVNNTDAPTFQQLQELGGVACLIELYSAQSILPATVVLSRQFVQCQGLQYSGGGPPPFVVPSPLPSGNFVPPAVPSFTATPTPIPSPITPNSAVVTEALSVTFIVAIIFFALCATICLCLMNRSS